MYNALREVGNEEAILVTYPELGHLCWDAAFSTPGLFEWLFGKKKELHYLLFPNSHLMSPGVEKAASQHKWPNSG